VGKLVVSGLLAAAILAGASAQGAPGVHSSRAPQPHRGKSVVVKSTKGRVIVFRRGNRKLAAAAAEVVPVGKSVLVPLGTIVDTSAGRATVTAAISRSGTVTARGSFAQGVFAVAQTGSDTAISLGGDGPRTCTTPRRLVSRAPGQFMVLAGASASRAGSGFGAPSATPVAWVTRDRCTATNFKAPPGRIDVVLLGSRRATARRAHALFARGHFRTTGRNSSATVRGRVVPAAPRSSG
jgi:hypothetical protein